MSPWVLRRLEVTRPPQDRPIFSKDGVDTRSSRLHRWSLAPHDETLSHSKNFECQSSPGRSTQVKGRPLKHQVRATYTSIEPYRDLICSLGVLRREEPEEELLVRSVCGGSGRVRTSNCPAHGQVSAIGLPNVKGNVRKSCAIYEIFWSGISHEHDAPSPISHPRSTCLLTPRLCCEEL